MFVLRTPIAEKDRIETLHDTRLALKQEASFPIIT
jgi:hypothetical protein